MFHTLILIFSSKQDPPDLDKMINDFFNRLFGKQSDKRDDMLDAFRRPDNDMQQQDDDDSSNSNKPPRRPSSGGSNPVILKFPKYIYSVIALGALLLYVFSGLFTVDESESAVMFRLGTPIGEQGPGLHWHLPFIENYQKVQINKVRRVEVGYRNSVQSKVPQESLMLTDNLNIIDMQFVIQFVLKDAQDYLFNNRNPEAAVQQVAETAMREIVGINNIDYVLYEGREDIAARAKTLMQETLDNYGTGIDVREVAVQGVQPPDQVQQAFEDAIKARQDRERKINEGQAYANDIIPRVRGRADRIREEASAYKQGVIARAEGDTQRFLQLATEYALAPQITGKRLFLETIEGVFQNSKKLIIDESSSNNILYLPLPLSSNSYGHEQFTNSNSGVVRSDSNQNNFSPSSLKTIYLDGTQQETISKGETSAELLRKELLRGN